jgi:hypothetical protein
MPVTEHEVREGPIAIDFDGVIGRPLLGLNVRIGSGEWDQSQLAKRTSSSGKLLTTARSALSRLRYSGREPMKDVGAGLALLAKQYRLVVVTARPASMQEPTWKWLQTQGFADSISELYTNSTTLPTPVYKLQTARSLHASYFVEDDGRTARYLSSNGVSTFLVDWPRNRGIYPANVRVVRNLIEVHDYIEGLVETDI